ncbi:MAG: exodeoxyribonuclease VII large subunit [Proteobacteria bacterium]|nr:exodeoxyribonuclease VII large subunit [Pseudomonadota bacterium]
MDLDFIEVEVSYTSLSNTPLFTVGELSQSLKRTVESTFSHVRVRGEISGFKKHTSGHVYLSLKDQDALISVVCWKGVYQSFSLNLEDGMDVIATGRVTTYPGRSQYQLVLEKVELAGRGALLKILEERKERLRQEGLFESIYKKQLPYLPRVIGIITSPTGAVIQDILHRLRERFPVHVLIWPVSVQGENSAQQVASAIEGFNALREDGALPRPDLLIVARGGGSLEDLWAFNEECVIRAAFKSEIPLISAIGHETDVTLIDFVSDKRAPTPTAAAEMAVPVRADLLEKIIDQHRRLILLGRQCLVKEAQNLRILQEKLGSPKRLIEVHIQKLDDLSEKLILSLEKRILQARLHFLNILPRLKKPQDLITHGEHRLKSLEVALTHALKMIFSNQERLLKQAEIVLEMTSYTKILERGFVLVRDQKTQVPITSALKAQENQTLSLIFKDGERDVIVKR